MTSQKEVYLSFSRHEVRWGLFQSGNYECAGQGSLFRLAGLESAWKGDTRVKSATKLLIGLWDPLEGSKLFDYAFEKLCKLISQSMPKMEHFLLAADLKMPDAKIALMLHNLPNLKGVQFDAFKEDFPLAFHFLGQLDHLHILVLDGVNSLDDGHLAGLLQSVPNLKSLELRGCKKGMHQTLQQIRHLEQLETLQISSAPQNWFMPADIHLLADSVERLPALEMHLGVEGSNFCLYQPQACLEPLLCALGAHASLDRFYYSEIVHQYTGDPETDPSTRLRQPINLFPRYQLDKEHIKRTIQDGPTMDQVLEQEIRKGRLQLPQDKKYDENLAAWVEAMIAVKDIQCQGANRWDCFHFLITQLCPKLLFGSPFWKKPRQLADQDKQIPNFRRPPVDNDNKEAPPSSKRMRVEH